jgi:hypothetical protein
MMGWYSLFWGKTAMFYWADGAERADRAERAESKESPVFMRI